MTLTTALWLATAAYACHILEEFMLNWRDWARSVLGLPVDWPQFYVTNAAVIVLGIVAASIAPQWPALALAFPALMLINAVFFHVLPVVRFRGRFSPGLLTAVVLFFPAAWLCFSAADRAGDLAVSALVLAALAGAVLMAFPVVLLKIRDLEYFRQDCS